MLPTLRQGFLVLRYAQGPLTAVSCTTVRTVLFAAPTCLRLDFYNNDTGKLLCRVEPVYGGTGGYVADGNGTFDEAGYVANPPCMFGVNSSYGLAEPPLMNGVTIRVEHTTNSTYGHHGEMGLPQTMLACEIAVFQTVCR